MLLKLILSVLPLCSSVADTCDVLSISEVEVVQSVRSREVVSGQQLDGEGVRRLGALSVADALHHFSGVQVKDYGGIGGLKTINVRSMGSQHTGIFYDGVELGNAQNGQVDLGQLSMENVESVRVYHGQRSALFQTASDFGHSGTVYLRTRIPINNHLRVMGQGGSFGLMRGSFLCERRLSERVSSSLLVNGTRSDGQYPFRYRRLNYDRTVAYDTTAHRHNGDVTSFHAELNLFGRMDRSNWHAKAYHYQSDRGIPGAIVNNVWRRGERQSDGNTFVQGQWQGDLTPRYSMRVLGKAAYYSTHYVCRDSTQFMADNRYRQMELYASTSHAVELTPSWSLSAACDVRHNVLWSDMPLFHTARRTTCLLALASALHVSDVRAQVSLMSTDFSHLSPSAFVCWDASRWLSLHAFAKQSYRLPTFNELYYTTIGNSRLRPETARQLDAGLQFRTSSQSSPWRLSLTADVYRNRVSHKIIAYPQGQQFRWTMLNLGEVRVTGVDLNAESGVNLGQWHLQLSPQYTWQRAIDVTSPADSYYRHQIPYVPHHSGSLRASLAYRGVSLLYAFTYTGERWSQQQNIAYNHLQPWYTSDLHLQYQTPSWRLSADVLNLLDQQYDVIVNYPMPGRSFRFSISYSL
ncbi:MAG: TonB-dependent receptor [Bacteroidales bacterium]|nr:TonB-dependent receptor [Candidatus Liminaster caballi]